MRIEVGDAKAAQAVAAALKDAISKEKYKVHLTAVCLSMRTTRDGDNVIELSTTDGYRLHRVGGFGGAMASDEPVLISGAELVKALQTVGKVAKHQPVTIETDPTLANTVRVCADGNAVTVPTIALTFPDVASLFDGSTDMETGVGVNGSYLAQLADAADDIARIGAGRGEPNPVILETVRVRKCMRVSSVSVCGQYRFDGLLMPQRVK
jgi:hypothetical protein